MMLTTGEVMRKLIALLAVAILCVVSSASAEVSQACIREECMVQANVCGRTPGCIDYIKCTTSLSADKCTFLVKGLTYQAVAAAEALNRCVAQCDRY